jgi:hypothetical protein
MAAQQNVVAAVEGGPVVLIAAITTVVLCFACVALLGRMFRPKTPSVTPAEGAVIAGNPDLGGQP